MMEFIFGIAEFLLQAVILLGVFLLAVAGVLALTQRKRGAGEEGVSRRAPSMSALTFTKNRSELLRTTLWS